MGTSAKSIVAAVAGVATIVVWSPNVEASNSIAVVDGHTAGFAGHPVVSDRDGPNEDLELAHCDNTVCAPASCNGADATIVGTVGNDIIAGTAGDDVIFAGDGNDTIDGRAGNDLVCGGDGEDVIDGGADDDRVYGGRWNRQDRRR
jgi:Ca2+-binding RTX toxin-like protein